MSTAVTCDAEKERIQSPHRHVEAKHYHVTFEPLFRAIPDIDFQGLTGLLRVRTHMAFVGTASAQWC